MISDRPAARDILFLLDVTFEDAAAGPGPFYCPDSTSIYGLLLSFPQLTDRLDVRRIGFKKPRTEIVELIGEANQSCPVLILAEGAASRHQDGAHNNRAYASDPQSIRMILNERHGFPLPHP